MGAVLIAVRFLGTNAKISDRRPEHKSERGQCVPSLPSSERRIGAAVRWSARLGLVSWQVVLRGLKLRTLSKLINRGANVKPSVFSIGRLRRRGDHPAPLGEFKEPPVLSGETGPREAPFPWHASLGQRLALKLLVCKGRQHNSCFFMAVLPND